MPYNVKYYLLNGNESEMKDCLSADWLCLERVLGQGRMEKLEHKQKKSIHYGRIRSALHVSCRYLPAAFVDGVE